MAMKWINPEEKEPLFEKRYLLLTDKDTWEVGYLREIKTTSKGQEFIWYDTQSEEIMNTITHYLNVELPKKEFKI